MTSENRWSPMLFASVVMSPNAVQLSVLLLIGTRSWDRVWPGVIIIDALFWMITCAIWFIGGRRAVRRSKPSGRSS